MGEKFDIFKHLGVKPNQPFYLKGKESPIYRINENGKRESAFNNSWSLTANEDSFIYLINHPEEVIIIKEECIPISEKEKEVLFRYYKVFGDFNVLQLDSTFKKVIALCINDYKHWFVPDQNELHFLHTKVETCNNIIKFKVTFFVNSSKELLDVAVYKKW